MRMVESFRDFCSRKRVAITLVAASATGLSLAVRQHVPRDPADFRDLWSVVGVGLVVAGLMIRSWAATVLDKGRVLATEGPYACCRHPLYLGSFLLCLGYCVLIADIWAAIALLAAVVLSYPAAMVSEERRLLCDFGAAWSSYSRAVPRFVPLRLPRGWGPVSWRNWGRNAEHKTLAVGLVGLAVIVGWRGYLVDWQPTLRAAHLSKTLTAQRCPLPLLPDSPATHAHDPSSDCEAQASDSSPRDEARGFGQAGVDGGPGSRPVQEAVRLGHSLRTGPRTDSATPPIL